MSGYGNPLAALAGGLTNALGQTIVQSTQQRHQEELNKQMLQLKGLEMMASKIEQSDPGTATAYSHYLQEFIGAMGKGGKKGKQQREGILSQFSQSFTNEGGETPGKPAEPAKASTGSGGAAGIPAINYSAAKPAEAPKRIPTPPGKMRLEDPNADIDRQTQKALIIERAKAKDALEKQNAEDAAKLKRQKAEDDAKAARADQAFNYAFKLTKEKGKEKEELEVNKKREEMARDLAAQVGDDWDSLDEQGKRKYMTAAATYMVQLRQAKMDKISAQVNEINQHSANIVAQTDKIKRQLASPVKNWQADQQLKQLDVTLRGKEVELRAEEEKLNTAKLDKSTEYNYEGIENRIQQLKDEIGEQQRAIDQVIANYNNTGKVTPIPPVKAGGGKAGVNNGAHTQPSKKVFPASKLQDYAKAHTNGDVNAARKELTGPKGGYAIDENK